MNDSKSDQPGDEPSGDNQYELNNEELAQKFNLETGQIDWQELQSFFARGIVIVVDTKLDLIDTAIKLSQDDAEMFNQYITQGLIERALDTHAKKWNEANTQFWSVVVSPWVLVQETRQ